MHRNSWRPRVKLGTALLLNVALFVSPQAVASEVYDGVQPREFSDWHQELWVPEKPDWVIRTELANSGIRMSLADTRIREYSSLSRDARKLHQMDMSASIIKYKDLALPIGAVKRTEFFGLDTETPSIPRIPEIWCAIAFDEVLSRWSCTVGDKINPFRVSRRRPIPVMEFEAFVLITLNRRFYRRKAWPMYHRLNKALSDPAQVWVAAGPFAIRFKYIDELSAEITAYSAISRGNTSYLNAYMQAYMYKRIQGKFRHGYFPDEEKYSDALEWAVYGAEEDFNPFEEVPSDGVPFLLVFSNVGGGLLSEDSEERYIDPFANIEKHFEFNRVFEAAGLSHGGDHEAYNRAKRLWLLGVSVEELAGRHKQIWVDNAVPLKGSVGDFLKKGLLALVDQTNPGTVGLLGITGEEAERLLARWLPGDLALMYAKEYVKIWRQDAIGPIEPRYLVPGGPAEQDSETDASRRLP